MISLFFIWVGLTQLTKKVGLHGLHFLWFIFYILLIINMLNIFYHQNWVYSVNHKYDRLNFNS